MLYHFLTVGFSLFAVAFLVKAIGFYGDYKVSGQPTDLFTSIVSGVGLLLSSGAVIARLA
jgi:hypothetical protein